MSDVSPLSPVLVAMDIPQIVGCFRETPIQGSAPATEHYNLLRSLPDRRLRLGFFHHRRAHWFAFFDETNLAMFRKTGAGWNQVTHDHILLKSAETIDLAERSRFGQDACCILERCCRDEAICFERGLGDPKEHRHGFRW